jgi:hypothetical protein
MSMARRALAQYAVALFYTAATGHYHFLTWFLTMLVVMVWFQKVGAGRMEQRFVKDPWVQWLASGLDWLQRVCT